MTDELQRLLHKVNELNNRVNILETKRIRQLDIAPDEIKSWHIQSSYGEIATATDFTVSVAATSTWYDVSDSSMEAGHIKNMMFENNALYVRIGGMYLCSYTVSYQGGNNGVYHFGISKNGEAPDVKSETIITSGGGYDVASSSFFIDLEPNNYIKLQLEDTGSPAQDVDIADLNLVIYKIY